MKDCWSFNEKFWSTILICKVKTAKPKKKNEEMTEQFFKRHIELFRFITFQMNYDKESRSISRIALFRQYNSDLIAVDEVFDADFFIKNDQQVFEYCKILRAARDAARGNKKNKTNLIFFFSKRIDNAFIKQVAKDLKLKKKKSFEDDRYQLFRNYKKKYKRLKVDVRRPNHQWQMDLMDLKHLERYNSRIRYLLVVIDVYSRYVWVK